MLQRIFLSKTGTMNDFNDAKSVGSKFPSVKLENESNTIAWLLDYQVKVNESR